MTVRNQPKSVSLTADPTNRRDRFFAWIILCTVIGVLVIFYLSAGLRASSGQSLIMPLDDAYIHFQYARQMALGQPFHYIAGDPATSGGTSLLYPILLAIGYRIGFQGDHLALWAIAIGVLAWIGSAWLLFRLATFDDRLPVWAGLLIALAFVLTGSLDWAFMSGMETGLTICVILWTLYGCVRDDFRWAIIAECMIAILRPEGVVIAGGVMLYFIARRGRKAFPVVLLPILAVLLQPLANLAATGSITASGLQAKSYLYNVPFDPGYIISTVWTVFARMWRELLIGVDSDGINYGTTLIVILAAIGTGILLLNVVRRKQPERVLILPVLIGFAGTIALLQTAFWQFKRYQQPLIAILFVLAAWTIAAIGARWPKYTRVTSGALSVGLLAFAIGSWPGFLNDYAANIHEVASLQNVVMQYVTATLPPDARIGVHDIGLMAYLGNVKTYDVVGLSTPGAAIAYRNGAGSVYEQMRYSLIRPDYFAIYPDALGIGYFTATDMFRDQLAHFTSTHPMHDVSSVGDEIVTRADWSKATFADRPWQQSTLNAIDGFSLVDSVNVSDLTSEAAHGYQWHQAGSVRGFPTELYEMTTLGCAANITNPACTVIDGGRLLNGDESMTIATQPGKDLLWITRVHPRDASTLQISVNDQPIAQRVILGGFGGSWLEIATLIPAAQITSAHTLVGVTVITTSGAYMPYYHWFYQGTYTATPLTPIPGRSAHFANGANLIDWHIQWSPAAKAWQLTLRWQADPNGAHGVDKVFVHLLDVHDRIISQVDTIPVNNTRPPGDWLPGAFDDSYTLSAPRLIDPRGYRIAIGLYDPVSGVPVQVTGGDSAGRLFITAVGQEF